MFHVLFLHPEPREQEQGVRALRAAGYRVTEARPDGAVAETVTSGEPDVIVIAANADASGGGDAARGIAALRGSAESPMLGITPDPGQRLRLLEAGCDIVLAEPLAAAELVAQVAGLLRATRRGARTSEAERMRRQLEAVFHAMSDGVMVFDLTGNVVLLNPAQARINGFASPEEMMRNLEFYARVYELSTPDGTILPVDQWPVSRVLRGEVIERLELRGLRRDTGRSWSFQFSGEPVRDASGRQVLAIIITRDVTKEKVVEERLIEAKEISERHRVEQEAILNSMTEGLVLFDPHGNLLHMNPAALAIHRFKSVDAVRMHLGELPRRNALRDLDGNLLPVEQWPISRALRGETFSNYEMQVYPADGGEPWVGSYGGTPVIGPDGRMVLALVTLRDVTTRKRAEVALAREQELLQRILDTIPVMITIIDPALKRFRFNRAFQQVLGWSEEDAAAGDFLARAYPDPSYRAEVIDYLTCLAPGWREFAVTAKSGLRVDSSWANIRLPDGVHVSVGIDIRQRKKAEQALRDSEELFRTFAETMPQLAFIADAAGGIRYSNRRFADFFGLEAGRSASRALDDRRMIYHPDDGERAREAWAAALHSGEPFEQEYRLRRRDGAYRWHLTRALPLRDAKGRIEQWVGTSTDITEQKEAAEELTRARDALAEANAQLERKVAERTGRLRESVAELEHFSYTLTHDLRSPLRAMHAFGDILSERYAEQLDDAGRDYLQRIVRAAARMDSLITDALNYSKVVQSQFPLEVVDPAPLLRGMIDSYPELQAPQAEIELEGPLPPVQANAAGLTQCFSNLLTNAVKFVRPGTRPRVRIRAEERGERLRLWIEDNGIGIAPEQHRRIFGMFERLSTEYPGTGVGLALVRKVVERMRGEVGVESAEGQGSRFWLEFSRPPKLD